jgi:hypothetical protein
MNIKSAKIRSEAVLMPFSAGEIGQSRQSFMASVGRAEVTGDGRQR